jgi:hypothetical protein
MTNYIEVEKAIRQIHAETSQVYDYPANGDEVYTQFAVPHCVECRVEYPCMTISVLDDPSNLINLDEEENELDD